MYACCIVSVYFPVRIGGSLNCCSIVYLGNICYRNIVTLNLSVNAYQHWRSECNVMLNMYHTHAAYVIVPLSVGVSLQRMNQFDRFS